mmetsp:Transcript_11755/g.21235  ORF Transcript_11755/g.21235 Transcript_11755/m.21235 type:complete len:212 (-) Transcript_11755:522-1157(-)
MPPVQHRFLVLVAETEEPHTLKTTRPYFKTNSSGDISPCGDLHRFSPSLAPRTTAAGVSGWYPGQFRICCHVTCTRKPDVIPVRRGEDIWQLCGTHKSGPDSSTPVVQPFLVERLLSYVCWNEHEPRLVAAHGEAKEAFDIVSAEWRVGYKNIEVGARLSCDCGIEILVTVVHRAETQASEARLRAALAKEWVVYLKLLRADLQPFRESQK